MSQFEAYGVSAHRAVSPSNCPGSVTQARLNLIWTLDASRRVCHERAGGVFELYSDLVQLQSLITEFIGRKTKRKTKWTCRLL